MPKTLPTAPGEPTLRSIAQLAGVTATTVSMALRGHPRISAATRSRVEKIATAQGYRPDPTLNRLMQHLRQRGTTRLLKGSICALHATEWGNISSGYAEVVLEAARARAQALGFAFEVLGLEETIAHPGRMRRVLSNRGVEGLLILPLPKPMELPPYAEWEHFSVVAATYSVLKPDFHRVVPHQFNNSLLLCRRLVERGYRRIGLIINRTYETRVNHNCSAAVSWQSLLGGTEFVRPFLFGMGDRADADAWFEEQQPDAIIVSGDTLRIMGLSGLELQRKLGVPVTCTSWFPGQDYPGIDEHPKDIGIKAVDVLASMILRNELGVPVTPTVTMIEGDWHGLVPMAVAPAGRRGWVGGAEEVRDAG